MSIDGTKGNGLSVLCDCGHEVLIGKDAVVAVKVLDLDIVSVCKGLEGVLAIDEFFGSVFAVEVYVGEVRIVVDKDGGILVASLGEEASQLCDEALCGGLHCVDRDAGAWACRGGDLPWLGFSSPWSLMCFSKEACFT